MKKYRCLLNGQNFLIRFNGVKAKYGFYQNLIVAAESPQQAELLATARLWHDSELKKITLNLEKDPPVIRLKTIWELDVVNDSDDPGPDRRFYAEARWWRNRKQNREQQKLIEMFSEIPNHEDGGPYEHIRR